MNKYLKLLIFYFTSFLAICLLNTISPGAPDGGLGLGSLAILLFGIVIMVMCGISIYKGIKDKAYFIIAAIHLLVLVAGFFTLFL